MWLLAAALVAAVAYPIAGPAGTAHAEPTPAEIEAEIDQAWRELAPVIERHNATRAELEERRGEAEELADKIDPLQAKVDAAMSEMSDIAVRAFKGGDVSAVNALLASGSPYHFTEQLAVLDRMARDRQERIAEVTEVKAEYEAEKAELDGLVEELSATEAELAADADRIDDEIERLQELRVRAYGESGGTGDLRPAACPAEYDGGPGSQAATFACEQIGKPYVWGSSGPDSYDCSGLTSSAWRQAGVSLPHNAAQQRNAVRYVDRGELRPGDLVFYYGDLSHVGIYVGDGWIVDASRPGVPVRMRGLHDGGPVHSYGRP